ncbi:sensor histidine kinase [Nonomuraea insulae]|uniref:Sensor histidine kinase n=1 Tax=Nonomuraea insulae TaxID=1616787 RepID=A0ABW1CNX5_9ACTN
MIASYGIVDAIKIISSGKPTPFVLVSLIDMVVILLMQVLHFARADRRNGRHRRTALVIQAVLVYLPLYWLGSGWLSMPSVLASSCLLALTSRAAWSAFGAIVLSNVVLQGVFDGFDPWSLTYVLSASVNGALILYGLIRLSETVGELDQSRAKMAQMAVEKERLRFARDLHDLLGYSLSTIILKIELSRRLGRDTWARAVDELDDVLNIARQALADVRRVSSGYRQLSLDAELKSARSILGAAGIDITIKSPPDMAELYEQASTALSTALREGATNILRHTDATVCEIAVERTSDQVRLLVTNDGLRSDMGEDCIGSGIANLVMRAETLGGRLTAGTLPDRRFQLLVEVPARPPAPPASQDGKESPAGRLRGRWAKRR